jgi:transposase
VSIIAALNQKKLHSPFVFEDYTNRELFVVYLEQVLIPNLKPGDVVIMDNASFHKGETIKNIIEAAQCTLTYLPPYSPDLNPIEHLWHAVKNSIRKKMAELCGNLFQAVEIVFA